MPQLDIVTIDILALNLVIFILIWFVIFNSSYLATIVRTLTVLNNDTIRLMINKG